jgi:SAM-dependent methyltransferase
LQAFHHFADPAASLAAMVEALAPSGQLFLYDLRRDVEPLAYYRRLDFFVSREPLIMARIFRDSVAASYTLLEIEALLAPFTDRPLSLGPLVLGEAAREAYVAIAPGGADMLPALARDISGQLFAAHLGPVSSSDSVGNFDTT